MPENEPELPPVPEPLPPPQDDVPGSLPAISKGLAASLLIGGIVVAVVLGWGDIVPLPVLGNLEVQVPKLLMALGVVAVIIERALAVVNASLSGDEKERMRALKHTAATNLQFVQRATLKSSGAFSAASPGLAYANGALVQASVALAAVEAKQQRLRVVLGFLLGLAVSAVSIRALDTLVTVHGETRIINLFNLTDIVLTAGILAGGSDGIAKLTQLLDAIVSKAKLRREEGL